MPGPFFISLTCESGARMGICRFGARANVAVRPTTATFSSYANFVNMLFSRLSCPGPRHCTVRYLAYGESERGREKEREGEHSPKRR